MSLFSGVVQQKRAVSYQDYWGAGGATESINGGGESQALRLAAVYGAVRMLSDGLSGLPLRAHRTMPDRSIRYVDLPQMCSDPTVYGTGFDWKHQIMTSLCLRGNAYGLVTNRDRNGYPTRVEWQHPDLVSPNGPDDTYWWGGRSIEWLVEGRPTYDIVHIRNFILPGRILGLSPVAAFRDLTETGLYAQRFGKEWFANGSVPSAILESDGEVTDTQALIVKRRFMEAAQSREPMALGSGVKYRQIQINPEESQFLETIQANATQVAVIYGVPPEDIGGSTGDSLTYATQESKASRFVQFSLRGYMARIEEALSRLLPRRVEVRFGADALIRTETLTRFQAYQIALEHKILNPDEVRAREELEPLPNGEGQSYESSGKDSTAPAPLAQPQSPAGIGPGTGAKA